MQENEFEKKMQQKMELLQVQPSESLWPKIALEVSKSDRRKKRFLFFFLLLAFIAAGSIITSTWLKKTNDASQRSGIHEKELIANAPVSGENKTASREVLKNNIATTEEKPGHHSQATTPLPATFTVHNGENSTANSHPLKLQVKAKTTASSTAPAAETISDAASSPGETAKEIQQPVVASEKNNAETNLTNLNKQVKKKATSTENNSIESPEITTAAVDVKKILPAKNDDEKKAGADEKSNTVKIPATKPDAVLKSSAKQSQKQQWGTAIYISAGFATTAHTGSLDKSLANNTSTSPAPGGNPVFSPSAVSAGVSFTAGAECYRHLSPKSTLSAGLQYRLLTGSFLIGNRISSSFTSSAPDRNEIYLAGSQNSYTSFFHFISLPVKFTTTLFKINQREVKITAGIEVAELLYSNALQFDFYNNIYYKNSSLFKNTQIGFSLGSGINIAGKNSAALYLGPEFYYSLTAFAGSGIYSNAHGTYVGIQLKKMLKK